MAKLLQSWEKYAVDQRRYQRAAYSTAANIVSKALNLLVLYISVPLTLGYLGEARFGIWMTLISTISVFGYLDFGIGSSLLNQVAYHAAAPSRERLRQIITHGLCVLTGIGACLLLVLWLGVRWLPWKQLFSTEVLAATPHLTAAAYTLVVLIGLSIPTVGLIRVFWGLQRYYVYFVFISVGRLLTLGLLFWIAYAQSPIYTLLAATYGVQLVFTLPLFWMLVREGLWGGFAWPRFQSDARMLLKQGLPFLVLSVGAIIAWDSDNLIIAKALGATAVAVFAIAVRLFQVVETGLQAVNNPLWAAYADAHAQQGGEFLQRLLKRSMVATLVLGVVGVGVLGVSQRWILRIWLHRPGFLPESLIAALAVWFAIRCAGNAFAMYLNAVRLMKPQVVVVTAFCVLALPLKIWMAGAWNVTGLAWASVIAYGACVIIPYATFYRRQWQAPLSKVNVSATAASPRG